MFGIVIGIIEVVIGIGIFSWCSACLVPYVSQQIVEYVAYLISAVLCCSGFLTMAISFIGKEIVRLLSSWNSKLNQSLLDKKEKEPVVEKKVINESHADVRDEIHEENKLEINVEGLEDFPDVETFRKMENEQRLAYKQKITDLINAEPDDAKKQKYYELLVRYGYYYYSRFID